MQLSVLHSLLFLLIPQILILSADCIFNSFLNTGSVINLKLQDRHRNILQELGVVIFFIPSWTGYLVFTDFQFVSRLQQSSASFYPTNLFLAYQCWTFIWISYILIYVVYLSSPFCGFFFSANFKFNFHCASCLVNCNLLTGISRSARILKWNPVRAVSLIVI